MAPPHSLLARCSGTYNCTNPIVSTFSSDILCLTGLWSWFLVSFSSNHIYLGFQRKHKLNLETSCLLRPLLLAPVVVTNPVPGKKETQLHTSHRIYPNPPNLPKRNLVAKLKVNDTIKTMIQEVAGNNN